MFNKSFIAALAATATLALSGIAKADTLANATATGTFTCDNVQYISLSIQANAYLFSNPAQAPQISGSVNIAGFSGNLAVNIGAPINSVYFDTELIGNVYYPRAQITTGRFFYNDLKTKKKTPAVAQVVVTQYGKRGTLCFHVTSTVDGTTLAETDNASGALADMALTSGLVKISVH